MKEESNSTFIKIIAIIGAVLIFVGVAWLIAKNWSTIPDAVKVIILVFSTLLAFGSGVFIKQSGYEGVGRALITLGALLYILSLFLISQIYDLATTPQHYAWLLLVAWTIIMITAYLLDSPENLLVSLILFFIWVVVQYFSHFITGGSDEGMILGLIFIFLSAGIILYSLSIFHNSIKHKFTNIYRFWTVFYFLAVFYFLSFQTILPTLSEYSFSGDTFTIFLISFIILSFFAFVGSILFASSKGNISTKEIFLFLGVVLLLIILILSTKLGAGMIGSCHVIGCYTFDSESSCNSAPDELMCRWEFYEGYEKKSLLAKPGESESIVERDDGYCVDTRCYHFDTEIDCNNALSQLNCEWDTKYTPNECVTNQGIDRTIVENIYEECIKYDNQKENCLDQDLCKWDSSTNIGRNNSLPTSLWLLWIIINFSFIGFIILILGYGQSVGSNKIVNLGMGFFILEIISRYIGFWMDLSGYVAFSILAILGGILLILGAWLIPKWRKSFIKKAEHSVPQQNS